MVHRLCRVGTLDIDWDSNKKDPGPADTGGGGVYLNFNFLAQFNNMIPKMTSFQGNLRRLEPRSSFQ